MSWVRAPRWETFFSTVRTLETLDMAWPEAQNLSAKRPSRTLSQGRCFHRRASTFCTPDLKAANSSYTHTRIQQVKKSMDGYNQRRDLLLYLSKLKMLRSF